MVPLILECISSGGRVFTLHSSTKRRLWPKAGEFRRKKVDSGIWRTMDGEFHHQGDNIDSN
jgi:elongation factor P hydroxylase